MSVVAQQSAKASSSPADLAGTQPAAFKPRLELFGRSLEVNRGTAFAPDYRLQETPLAKLVFEYDGSAINASDPRDSFYVSDTHGGLRPVLRDLQGESETRQLLERFGLVELRCLDAYDGVPDGVADYVVDIDGDLDALCTFGAEALPYLRRLGWSIRVHDSYPCHVVETQTAWHAKLEKSVSNDEKESEDDWFSLELGIDIDGERVNLLPILLEVLEASPGGLDPDILTRTATRQMALPLGNRRVLPIAPERLRRILQVFVEMLDPEQCASELEELPLHANQATLLAELEEAISQESVRWETDTLPLLTRGRALRQAGDATQAPEPLSLRATLRPYQKEGVSCLQHWRAHAAGGVLADDMGLGKTLQTIAHLVLEKEHGRLDQPALIVAPTSLVGNWRRELRRFAPGLNVLAVQGPKRHRHWAELGQYDVLLTTYPLLPRDIERWKECSFHYLILDEAQTIKNPRSQVNRAAAQLASRYRLCLTGTPIENSLSELWTLFDFLMPGFLGSAASFRQTYEQPILRDGSAGRLEQLRARVAPFILRRMKSTVAKDLPPKTEMVRSVELTGAQRDLYESIRVSAHAKVRQLIRERGVAGSAIDILDALMKLRQVCCDPRLVAMQGAQQVQNSTKLEQLFDMLATMLPEGRRVLVFSQFTSMLALIAAGLRQQNIGHVVLTGDTKDRSTPVDAFQRGDVDVFLISLKAGGTGLNLTGADTVIHYDPWWNPAVQAQATDRAYRIGQTRPVFAYSLIAASSVEERILNLQRQKQHLADNILGSGNALGLSEQDVNNLFAPLG